jgi:hypothetical protein
VGRIVVNDEPCEAGGILAPADAGRNGYRQYSPEAVGLVGFEEAKARLPDLGLDVVDVTEQPEVAVKYRVLATPAIAIDGRLEFVGAPSEAALRARLEIAAGA